jgi:excisionase family DNA binding protein
VQKFKDDEPSKYLTIEQSCGRYCLGRTTIHSLIKSGEIVTRKLGSKTLIDRADADRFFENLPSAAKKRRTFKTHTGGR